MVMAKRTWSEDTAKQRISSRIDEVSTVTIKEYVRTTDLTGLANGVAYRVDGVHLYVDILNIGDMLNVTEIEGVTSHRRTLRFLNLHYRAVRDILLDVDAIEVDFHNQRLHAVFAKPYDDEKGRIFRAVATAQLIRDVLAKTGEDGDDPLPAAKTRIGIDSGKALAVNNGRRSSREPLFLGNPANQAAKRAGGDVEGIYMTNNARDVVGWDEVLDVDASALTQAQIQEAQDEADLPVTVDDVLDQWEEDLTKSPIGSFDFSRHTPPFCGIDLEKLTPGNSRRQESTSLYGDIDNFTRYVADRVDDDEDAKDVVKTLHVLRGELDSVLYDDFAGKKIRFIGDCIHGVLIEGTAQTTDDAETSKNALLCAAAMRSSFNLAMEELKAAGIDAGDLGLAIGLEHGVMSVTRLGIKGERIRCCISRSVLASEDEQLRCNGRQTAIGPELYKHAPEAFQLLFGSTRRRADFDYLAAEEALAPKTDSKKASALGSGLLQPATATAAAAGFAFGKAAAQPSRSQRGFS
jgi:class 3 adenylate cyclase